LSAEDLNSHEKYIETADTWSISPLYCIDVKIPLIDTVCAISMSLYIPGGIGKLCSTHGVWGTTGKLTGGKKSALKLSHSSSLQAKSES
jgi:hypothetical protein